MTPRRFEPVVRQWPGSTVVCAGSGPSLTKADLDLCRGRARVIVVNDAYRLALWSDALYAADLKWWNWNNGVPEFKGQKFSIEPKPLDWSIAHVLRNAGKDGLELKPDGLRTGANSGFQAINLAVHLGAVRVLLLGCDMKGQHFFGKHRDSTVPPFAQSLKAFQTLVTPLAAAGVEIFNCTPGSALTAFPMARLQDVLPARRPEYLCTCVPDDAMRALGIEMCDGCRLNAEAVAS